MYTKFAYHRANYRKGQVFPFLIAVLCIIVIFIMITVNLGKLGVMKTDTANAADAAALAAASVLSGTLLGYGLKSDMMCGYALISLIFITIDICRKETLAKAILRYAVFTVHQLTEYYMAKWDSSMAWSNAKKTALSYAFKNAGIDEPRPNFEDFVRGVYGVEPKSLSAADLQSKYAIYLKGDDPADATTAKTREKIKYYTQSGFSRFLEDDYHGYWDINVFDEVQPASSSPHTVRSGYGWNNRGTNSYCPGGGCGTDYTDNASYKNYIEVAVSGASKYPVKLLNLYEFLLNTGEGYWEIFNEKLPWTMTALALLVWIMTFVNYVSQTWWLAIIIATVITAVYIALLIDLFPVGLKMDEQKEVDNNYITVTVERYKKDKDNPTGLWAFRYGTIRAQAASRAYREKTSPEKERTTIEPAMKEELYDMVWQAITNPRPWQWDWFDNNKHLFETELVGVM